MGDWRGRGGRTFADVLLCCAGARSDGGFGGAERAAGGGDSGGGVDEPGGFAGDAADGGISWWRGVAIWVIAAGPNRGGGEAPSRRRFGWRWLAGVGFGIYFVALKFAGAGGVVWPMATARIGSLTCVLADSAGGWRCGRKARGCGLRGRRWCGRWRRRCWIRRATCCLLRRLGRGGWMWRRCWRRSIRLRRFCWRRGCCMNGPRGGRGGNGAGGGCGGDDYGVV